jgi:anti-anti-sigma factor
MGDRMTPAASLVRTFANTVSDLEDVVRCLGEFLERHRVVGRAAYVTNLAVEELATNVLKYGYDDDRSHLIGLRVEVHPEAVVVSVEDDGHAFDPLRAPTPPQPTEGGEPGGLGLALVRQLSRDMRYERQGGKNRSTVIVDRHAAEENRAMAVPRSDRDDLEVVTLRGRLDAFTSRSIEEQLLQTIDGGVRRLIVDLGSVDYVSSVGLRLLLVTAKRLRKLGGELAVSAPQPAVREALEFGGFGRVFPAFASTEEALERWG